MTASAIQERSGAPAQAANSQARIRVRSLLKRFGALEVFNGVDFDVGEREIVTIVGPSGCGKTTLLRCIDGLLPVDGGDIWCNGVRVTEPIAGMAMVFQRFGLFPWKTVSDNVGTDLRIARPPPTRSRTRAELHQTGGARRLRARLSLPDVGRHAAALRAGARTRGRAERAADGRAVARSTPRRGKFCSSSCCVSGRLGPPA